jgi:hypothetical protein
MRIIYSWERGTNALAHSPTTWVCNPQKMFVVKAQSPSMPKNKNIAFISRYKGNKNNK